MLFFFSCFFFFSNTVKEKHTHLPELGVLLTAEQSDGCARISFHQNLKPWGWLLPFIPVIWILLKCKITLNSCKREVLHSSLSERATVVHPSSPGTAQADGSSWIVHWNETTKFCRYLILLQLHFPREDKDNFWYLLSAVFSSQILKIVAFFFHFARGKRNLSFLHLLLFSDCWRFF